MISTTQQPNTEEAPRVDLGRIDNEQDPTTAERGALQSAASPTEMTGRMFATQHQQADAAIQTEASILSTGGLNNSLTSGVLTVDSTPTLQETPQPAVETHCPTSPEPPEYVQGDVAAAPPAYYLAPGQVACHTSSGRIITRIIANRIDAHPLWDTQRDGRPSGHALQSFAVILSISPSCTFADFKALLTPRLEERIPQNRKSGPREGEIIKAWTYVKWREPAKGFLGLRKWKTRTLGVDQMNWATIMVALRDRTLVGELKVTFWNEVPLSDAERARQLAIAHMYRTTLRPFGAW